MNSAMKGIGHEIRSKEEYSIGIMEEGWKGG
jgi:hypothetical protein